MRFLAQSMGNRINSSVNRFTSAAILWDDAPGNHAGMKARIGKLLIKVSPGLNNRVVMVTFLSAPATQESLTDSTSYPYIAFIGIPTDILRHDNQKTGRTRIWCCTHLVVLLEFLWALKQTIEHRVNLLQHDTVIVLHRILAKNLLHYLPMISPYYSVSHETDVVLHAHPEEVWVIFLVTRFDHGSRAILQFLDRKYRSVWVHRRPFFKQLLCVLQIVQDEDMATKSACMNDATYDSYVNKGTEQFV